MNCSSCKNEVQEQWVACPFCAANLRKLLCECGKELNANWKACPHCGRGVATIAPTPAGVNQTTQRTEIPVERCFQIYACGKNAFYGVFEDAFEKLANAGRASEMLASVSQRQLEARLASAMKALCDSISSEPEFAGMNAPAVDQRRYFRTLSPVFTAIQMAEQNLADRDIPDGALAKFWRATAHSFTDPTALTANAIAPGIGIVGNFWSGFSLAKKDEEAMNAFRKSIDTFREQMDAVFAECYDDIAEELGRQGIRFATSGDTMAATFKRLEGLYEAMDAATSVEDHTRLLSEVKKFLAEYPFSGRAHCICAFGLIGLERFEDAERAAYEAYSLDNENHVAMVLLLLTRLAQQRWDDAAKTATFALDSLKADPSMCQGVASALKAVPSPVPFRDCMIFVASTLLKDSHPLGCLLQARLEASAARNDECRLLLSKFLVVAPLEMEDVTFLRTDEVLSAVVKTAFAGVLSGRPNHLRIAQCVVDCKNLWFGSIPAEKRDAAKGSFVQLHSGERLICYCDTTVFGGGKDGFALTDSRILWHELWGTPCAVKYSAIKNFEVNPTGDETAVLTLHTGTGEHEGDTKTYSQAPAGAALGLFNYLILLFAACDGKP